MGQLKPASRTMAWTALAAGPVAWAAHHQFGSNANFANCQAANGGAVIATGLAALAVAIAGGIAGVAAWRRAGATEPTTRFIGIVAIMACALFGLTIGVQMLAGVLVPACFE